MRSTPGDGPSDIIASGARRRFRDLDVEPETVLIGLIGVMLFVVLALGVWLFTQSSGVCEGDTCAGAAPIGVARTADGSAIAVHYVRCGPEAVTRIAIERAATNQPIWELSGSYRGTRTAFVAGQPTDELTETVPLEDLPTGSLVAVVEADAQHSVSFERSELLRGFVLYQGFALTADEFIQEARANGDCADWEPALGSGPARLLQIGLLALAAAVGVALAMRYRPDARERP